MKEKLDLLDKSRLRNSLGVLKADSRMVLGIMHEYRWEDLVVEEYVPPLFEVEETKVYYEYQGEVYKVYVKDVGIKYSDELHKNIDEKYIYIKSASYLDSLCYLRSLSSPIKVPKEKLTSQLKKFFKKPDPFKFL